MAETKWTNEQLSAIDERSKTLLVSAAAGSGKTATLTERIIRSLTDKDKNKRTEVDALLIVTFTNAAADELRAKVTKALEKTIAQTEDEKLRADLQKQLNMLPSAQIRTIDSFCNDILKQCADRVGLSRGYRIADKAELALIGKNIMNSLIADLYNGGRPDVATPAEVEALSDCITEARGVEALADNLLEIHMQTSASDDGVDMLLPTVEAYNSGKYPELEKSPHCKYLIEITHEMASHYRAVTEKYIRELSSPKSKKEAGYLAMARADKDKYDKILAADTYTKLRDVINSGNLGGKVSGKDESAATAEYYMLREMMEGDYAKFDEYFKLTEVDWRRTMDIMYAHLVTLYRIEKCFDELFLKEKKRLSALDYCDVERLCYECLVEKYEEDGEIKLRRTDIAENLSHRYAAVYIDEYQDVSYLQDSIFRAISRQNNCFMVGDIKQSIYCFRYARPEIFAKMKDKFPLLETNPEGDEATIFMSKNFRCSRGIVDFVNSVFDRTFSLTGKSIGYQTRDRLEFGKKNKNGEPPYETPVLCITESTRDKNDELSGGPRVIVEKIKELIATGRLYDLEEKDDKGKEAQPEEEKKTYRDVKEEDIAIIVRKFNAVTDRYMQALEESGIPIKVANEGKFFLSSEILLALCLLNSIDNPTRDIYLAGLMCSPLYSFSMDELYKIRYKRKGDSLYADLVGYVNDNPDYEKGKGFLDTLHRYRTIAEGMPVDVLIARLYRESGLMALAVRSGGGDNLTLLYDYARKYEAGAFKGLYSFISFINSALNMKTSFDDKREGKASDAVKFITAHSSKGLEYPIVIFGNASCEFKTDDLDKRMIFSTELGVSFCPRTPSGVALIDSPLHKLTIHNIIRKRAEEELRILYVALTRAREKLFVIGKSSKKDISKYRERMQILRENLSPYVIRSMNNCFDLMVLTSDGIVQTESEFAPRYVRGGGATDDGKGDGAESENPETPDGNSDESADGKDGENTNTIDEAEVNALADEFVRRFTFEYPDKHLTTLPEKLSVSQALAGERTLDSKLNPEDEEPETLVDGAVIEPCESDETDSPLTAEEVTTRLLPSFDTGSSRDESAKRGIATHKFLQFCEPERLYRNGVEVELDTLVRDGFISPQDKGRVRLGEIRRFLRSRLFAEMRSAKSVHRELRFNVRFPAHIFTTEADKKEAYRDREVLVQGVIDCLVEYPDGTLGLFDYKTDRLTKEELTNRSAAEKRLREAYSTQLSYYAYAVEQMFGRKPVRVEVYSLPLGDTVSVI